MADAKRKSNWTFWLALAALVAVLPVAYFLFLEQKPAPVFEAPVAAETTPAAPVSPELRLSKVEGDVEVRRAEGEWRPAELNAILRTSDAVRTMKGGRATLAGQNDVEVVLESSTDISVEELTASLSKVMLGRGMATASVKGDGKHTFEVRAAQSDAVARTRTGTFTLSGDGAGVVAVGTREGEVEFEGGGKVVIVRAGQQSLSASKGQAPSEPMTIPSSLLLKVQWPEGGVIRTRTVVVRGSTTPGTWVEVGGQHARVDAKGAFSATVQLREGTNDLKVRARSVGGIAQEDGRPLRVDTTPPKVGIDPNLWSK